METLQEETNDVAFSTFIGVLVSVCGNALISVALNVQKRAHNNIQERQMANYFANMDEPPQWISTTQYNGFYPDDGYSSPRSSLDSSSSRTVHTSPSPSSSNRSRARSEAELIEHQKFIMTMAQEQTKGGETEYLKSKLWWLGISLMILGEVGNFVAYGFAPASTIAPLGTTTLVSNVILAPLMLKEVFRKRDLLGVVLAVTGAAMVVFSSNSEEIALSPELIMESLTQLQSIIYFILTGVAIVILTILSPIYGTSSIMIDLGLVAIYGGYTVLSTKSVASLLSLTFFKMFAYPVSYLLIFVLVVTAVLQIKYLNKALQRFDSTEVIPTQFVLFTVSAIIGSAVLYHDFDGMDYEQMSRFMIGCTIEFLGVYLITSKRVKRPAYSPALSSSADSGTAISFTDEEEALDRVNLLPSEQQAQHAGSHPLTTSSNSNRKRYSSIQPFTNAAGNRSSHVPITFEAWQEANSHIANSLGSSSGGHKRRSSVFRGISMASQLLDRNEESQQQGSIQLPTSGNSAPHNNIVGNLISNIQSAISHNPITGSGADHHNHHNQHHNSNQAAPTTVEDADAVEIDIPTPSSFQAPQLPLDRELMPMNSTSTSSNKNQRRGSASAARLININEEEYDRDLS